MNYKKLILALPILFFACESEKGETGTWSISGDILTMSVAGDSSCTDLTLSK